MHGASRLKAAVPGAGRRREAEFAAAQQAVLADKWGKHIAAGRTGLTYEELAAAAGEREQASRQALTAVRSQFGRLLRERKGLDADATVRARPGGGQAFLRVLHRKSLLCGGFCVGARGA